MSELGINEIGQPFLLFGHPSVAFRPWASDIIGPDPPIMLTKINAVRMALVV